MRFTIAILLVAVLLSGCSGNPRPPQSSAPTSSDDEIALIARRLDTKLLGSPSVNRVVLPQRFDGLPWSAIQDACLPTNHDLRPYAGESAEILTYRMDRALEGRAEYLHVIRQGELILGAYTSVEGVDGGPASLGLDWRR